MYINGNCILMESSAPSPAPTPSQNPEPEDTEKLDFFCNYKPVFAAKIVLLKNEKILIQ
jgi:hypothetical protein